MRALLTWLRCRVFGHRPRILAGTFFVICERCDDVGHFGR